MSRKRATALVTNASEVCRHSWLPMITFQRRERRFRRNKSPAPTIKFKYRKLAYCSNADGCIFSYYAYLLNDKYEHLINEMGIDAAVIGYRKIGSNIDLALQAFREVKTRGSCVAFAYDISGFFDNIVHAILKRNWGLVLGCARLPSDHFKVFQRLTSFSTVDRRACLRRLGEKPSARDRDIKRRPLCSIEEYRQKIRGGNGSTNLVVRWKRDYGIPQGTPLSALAANIAMIGFDKDMHASVTALGGSYRRYSDDILIIVPVTKRHHVDEIIARLLRFHTRRLKLNKDKREEIEFIPGALAAGRGTKALQYLGFLFDGEKYFLRSGTIAKYYRRMHRAVSAAISQQKKATKEKLPTRSTLYRRALLADSTHLGVGNFVTGYTKNAEQTMGSKAIKRQLRRHPKKLAELINRNSR